MPAAQFRLVAEFGQTVTGGLVHGRYVYYRTLDSIASPYSYQFEINRNVEVTRLAFAWERHVLIAQTDFADAMFLARLKPEMDQFLGTARAV